MTIVEQLALEKTMSDQGARRFMRAINDKIEGGTASELTSSRVLMAEYIEELVLHLRHNTQTKRRGRQNKCLQYMRAYDIDPYVALFITLSMLFNGVSSDDPVRIQSLCISIGSRIEDDVRFSAFEKTHGEYYHALIEDFKREHCVLPSPSPRADCQEF